MAADSPRTAWLELDPVALRHNLARARTAAPGTRIMATIKTQAYGHGLLWAARTLADVADGFAVASVGEGVVLREAGFAHPVCVLNGPVEEAEFEAAARHGLDLVIHQAWHVERLEQGLPGQIGVWLKIDSGMGRVGVRPADGIELYARLRACSAVREPVGLMTHMARADERGSSFTRQQWDAFAAATTGLAGPRSAANSAGILGWPDTHADWIRPGIMLYGCSPFVEGAEPALDLWPVMTFRSRLVAINRLPAGAAVGYGCTWSCPEEMDVGVVATGYGDGYPRAVSNGTPVLIGERRASIIGRVSMDKITVDLRKVPDAAIGDPVTLWGRGLPVEDIATAAGTIPYELLCSVCGRVAVRD